MSERDYLDFKELFEKLGIKEKITYGTFDAISEKVINKDGDLRSMTQEMLSGREVTAKI